MTRIVKPIRPDIVERVRREYPVDQQTQVVGALSEMEAKLGPGSHPRIVRCVLHLAHGNIENLLHYIKNALGDWRDVIWWAEYDAGERRLRDFNQPFFADSMGAAK